MTVSPGASFKFENAILVRKILLHFFMNIDKVKLLECIERSNLIGVKAGSNRDKFLDIWMVVVDDRIFARSWGLSEKSWYTVFLQEPFGAIRCGDKIVQVKAVIPARTPGLDESISSAYLAKYDHGDNSFYAQGIIKPAHVERTMEFILL
ncbi:MAG: DUF2255 family protein [Ferruginibacter sp.]